MDSVRLLLGDSWHPGGLALTAQLARLTGINRFQTVLDVACGNGSSANFLSKEFGCRVIGVDVLPENVREAYGRTSSNKFLDNGFIVGDSHRIPLSNLMIDVVLLECTLSSFQDKESALREIHRVLRPGSMLGISDVVVNGEIPDELKGAQFQDLCVAGALSQDEYSKLLELSGFRIMFCQDKDNEALEFVESIRKKLFAAQLLVGIGKISIDGDSLDRAKHLARISKAAIQENKLGYAIMIAQKS